jgi:hypothetical protein
LSPLSFRSRAAARSIGSKSRRPMRAIIALAVAGCRRTAAFGPGAKLPKPSQSLLPLLIASEGA